jgi:hypothetical protein
MKRVSVTAEMLKRSRQEQVAYISNQLATGFALDIPLRLRCEFWLRRQEYLRVGCCCGSLPSRIREAGINGLLPAVRVPSIYSVSPLERP